MFSRKSILRSWKGLNRKESRWHIQLKPSGFRLSHQSPEMSDRFPDISLIQPACWRKGLQNPPGNAQAFKRKPFPYLEPVFFSMYLFSDPGEILYGKIKTRLSERFQDSLRQIYPPGKEADRKT